MDISTITVTAKDAVKWLVANRETIGIVTAALLPYVGGKAKKYLAIAHDLAVLRGAVKYEYADAATQIQKLPLKGSLNLEQARNIVTITPGGGVKVNSMKLAGAVMSSGDGGKALKKLSHFFKKIF